MEYDDVIVSFERRGTTRWLVQTPKVLEKAREHFGCSSLEGVELEDLNRSSAGSHWDSRIMFSDFMISHIPSNPIYSAITFAYFEDTGYYKVNWDNV